ncbi:MAG: hypothetical protein U5O39_15190 [Gammaproteobacteria bacterium]|nr:hypothetical protein [Gammaproteobacteria bacterium]
MTQLQQQVWTTDSGLSLDMVKDVEVSSGILWVATEEGLDKFDGLRMQNVDLSRQGTSPFFEDLVPHPDSKQVFAASYYHGILVIDAEGAWSVLPDSPRAIKALAISPEGLLVAGKRQGGVQVLPVKRYDEG